MSLRTGLSALLLGLLSVTAACSAGPSDEGAGDESDLTSITARSRSLEFVGTVYVQPTATDDEILSTVRSQAQTAFGPLRTSDIAVNSRELRDIDTSTIVKRKVKMIDTGVNGDAGKDMLEVKYTYKDNAVVALRYANRTSAPLALMSPSYRLQTERILKECTANDQEAREFLGQIWYVFEPRVDTCQIAMRDEEDKITADRAKLPSARTQVTTSEVNRLYIPITAKLGADKTNRGQSYPDYQKLYAGGVQKDKLVVSLVYGLIDHEHPKGLAADYNWAELMTNLSLVVKGQSGFKFVSTADNVDLSSFTLKSGKKVDNASVENLVRLHDGEDSLGLTANEQTDLDTQFAERVLRKWVAIERPVRVKVGNAPERDFAVQILFYFGAESNPEPHKFAMKNSDVFLYNGHSYIGNGPLDPRNFTPESFPKSYQLLWIDGCVSYNYYEKDYIPLKEGGTKNLDLITNGIEAPSWQSGTAMGQFLSVLLDGKGASYKDLLVAAKDTEALRVVDGELDNEFTPARFPLSVRGR